MKDKPLRNVVFCIVHVLTKVLKNQGRTEELVRGKPVK